MNGFVFQIYLLFYLLNLINVSKNLSISTITCFIFKSKQFIELNQQKVQFTVLETDIN